MGKIENCARSQMVPPIVVWIHCRTTCDIACPPFNQSAVPVVGGYLNGNILIGFAMGQSNKNLPFLSRDNPNNVEDLKDEDVLKKR